MHPDGYIPAPKRREFFKLLAVNLLTVETLHPPCDRVNQEGRISPLKMRTVPIKPSNPINIKRVTDIRYLDPVKLRNLRRMSYRCTQNSIPSC